MTLQLLNPRTFGSANDWTVIGADDPWSAVTKGSGDASYLGGQTVSAITSLFCGDGRVPIEGFVASVLVKCRIRRQQSSTGGSVTFQIDQNGTPQSVITTSLPPASTDWQDVVFPQHLPTGRT